MMPVRIQQRRSRGWRMPEGTSYVGRPGKWGNPYRVGVDGTAAECVAKYEAHLSDETVALARQELRGRNLACWCPADQPCHADVLLRVANS